MSSTSSTSAEEETYYGYEERVGCTVSLKDYCFSIIEENTYACISRPAFCRSKTEDKKRSKEILSDINLVCKPGELLAVLGPSGCGKTTLLNCIARRTVGVEAGELLYNGRDLSRLELLNQNVLSYVMSQDKHMEFITVRETLYFAAKLKMRNSTKAERNAQIDALLLALDLNGCKKTLVGGTWSKGLSSGEIRRLSIAIELLDNPDILLLDEPTTGLDSTRASLLIPVLKQLAEDGQKTVVMTIHQPSSQVYQHFDRIAIMSRGRIICSGKAEYAMAYINSRFLSLGMAPYTKACNPADFLLDFVSCIPEGRLIDPHDTRIRLTEGQLLEWADHYKHTVAIEGRELHDRLKEDPMALVIFKPALCGRWWTCFSTLLARMSLNTIRDPMETVILIVGQVILTVWLGLIFLQSCGEDPPITWSLTAKWGSDLWDYIDGDHTIDKAINDQENWAPHEPTMKTVLSDDEMSTFSLGGDDDPLPTFIPIDQWLEPVDFPLSDYTYTDYGTGIDPESDPSKNTTTIPGAPLNLNYDDFPIKIPGSIPEVLSLLQCVKDKFVAIPNLDYAELFSDTRYPHWDFNEIPDGIKATLDSSLENYEESRDIMQAIYRAVALGDFAWYHINWNDLADYEIYDESGELNPWIRTASGTFDKLDPVGVGMPFWFKFMACYRDELNALMGCLNFPNLPILRDNVMFSALGVDLSCEKAESSWPNNLKGDDTSKATRRLFGEKLPESFVPYMQMKWDHRRRLATLEELEFTNSDEVSEGLIAWAQKFLGFGPDCTHQLCEDVGKMKGDLGGDIKALLSRILKELHIGGMMMFMTAFIQFASFNAILTFQQERIIFNRESDNHLYPVSSYFVAKNIGSLPFQYSHTILGFLTLYFLAGIDLEPFWDFLAMAIVTVWAMYGFNFFFSACSKTLEMAIFCVPLMVVTMLVTSGFFVREDNFPAFVAWIKYFSATRWSFHGFSLIMFPRGESWAGIDNKIALGLYGVGTGSVEECYWWLIGMGFMYRFAAYFMMRYFHRKVGLES